MSAELGEIPLRFPCGDMQLVGILHRPAMLARSGVVVVTGGPQYRVGSHRQFVSLARALAANGIAVLRFDTRGMGDSDGDFPGFEHIDPDIEAAVDCLAAHAPGIEAIALWGLCDAASAILFYAHRDARVKGIALLNPWARTEASLARAYVKHYYLARLFDPEFWHKVRRGEFSPFAAAGALWRNFAAMLGAKAGGVSHGAAVSAALPDRMCAGLGRFRGPVLLVLSGRDLTAKEFEDAAGASPAWCRLLAEERVTRCRLQQSDHTFSRREWSDQVARWTLEWVRRSIGPTDARHECRRSGAALAPPSDPANLR